MRSSKLFDGLEPGQLPVQVEKKILHVGHGDFPVYKDGTRIKFHFETRVQGDDETIVDNTKKMGKPMELLLGKQFKLEIWEAMLKTMAVGEVAKFSVPKLFIMSYPMVSKALRDSLEGKKEHHCCGMMSQGCGYHDLDELMKTPKDLEFIFEIVEVKNIGEYERESWQLTPEELLASVPILREEGNLLFKTNDIAGATKKYFDAIARIEQLALKEKPGGEESQQLEALKVPLLLNYALCLMKVDNHYEAIQHLTTALGIDKDNVKGLFRRGQCHAYVGSLEEASADYNAALKLDPSLKTRVSEELKKLSSFEKEQDKKDKVAFQKMFTS